MYEYFSIRVFCVVLLVIQLGNAVRGSDGECRPDEEYHKCGTACPDTCDNYELIRPCTLQCVPGCFCGRGLVRNQNGDCIPPSQC